MKLFFLFFLSVFLVGAYGAEKSEFCVLYEEQPPYQYTESKEGFTRYKGMDIKLLQSIFSKLEYNLNFRKMDWDSSLNAIKNGECDILLGAYKTKSRSDYAYFSESFRNGQDLLFIRAKDVARFPYQSVKALLNSPNMKNLKLGFVTKYQYSSPIINEYIANPSYPKNLIEGRDELANVHDLLTGRIDGFFADSITMDLLLWKSRLSDEVVAAPMKVGSMPVFAMFSKKTVDESIVHQFNRRLNYLQESAKYQQIIRQHVIPIFIAMTTETFWYHVLEVLGTMFYAISGLLLAKEARFSFSGAFILAMLPGIGGGVMRDVMLDRAPVGVLRTPLYFLTVIITALMGYLIIRAVYYLHPFQPWRRFFMFVKHHYHARLSNIVRATDAFGLAAFTVIGVMVAVEMQATPLWLWGPIIAVLSSCGGGIVRDFFMGRGLNKTFFYETSYIWGLMLSLYIIFRTQSITSDEIFYAIVATVVGVISTRVIILKSGFETKPYWLIR